MPENWKTYSLSELIDINSNQIKKGDLDWINYIDIKSVGTGFYENPLKLDFDNAPSRARRELQNGNTVISAVRPNLKSFFYCRDIPENAIASTGFVVLTAKNIDPRFLYYLTTNDAYTNFLVQSCSGSAYPAFSPKVILDSKVTIPPLQEQKAIAAILSALDDKIELNLQMNKTLEEMAMALYKHWFVDFGPFQNGKFVDSELGMIPEGWEVKSIYEIANYVNGAAFKPSELIEEGLYVIKISELNGGISKNTGKSVKQIKSDQIIDSGSVLFSWSATLDIFLWDKGEALLNQHIFNVLPNGTVSLEVLYFLLKNIIKYFKAIAADRATTMGHIKLTHLKETFIAIPNQDIQLEIDEVFKPLYCQILENLAETQTLTTLRDTLLPKLISGAIRVKDVEQMAHVSL